MTEYEKYSTILQVLTTLAASIFAIWQIFINLRLKKLSDFVAVAIIPGNQEGPIKLLNTGKINLYIHGFEINGILKILNKSRLISSASLDSSYYWLPGNNIPKSGLFDIKIYLTDEYNKKYVTIGQGESYSINIDKIRVDIWTNKTEKYKWEFLPS